MIALDKTSKVNPSAVYTMLKTAATMIDKDIYPDRTAILRLNLEEVKESDISYPCEYEIVWWRSTSSSVLIEGNVYAIETLANKYYSIFKTYSVNSVPVGQSNHP